MKENIGRKLSIQEIAEHLGYSSTFFSSLFSQRTGYPPLNYFNMLKIQEACNMLKSDEIRINQVCCKIGIEDAYYFSRLFKKIMGMSPKDYRKLKKG